MSTLWYTKPAAEWEEALPLGNGRLGAMIAGNLREERIQVNEETIWYGGWEDRLNPDARENLPKLRELVRQGRISEAEHLIRLAFRNAPRTAANSIWTARSAVCSMRMQKKKHLNEPASFPDRRTVWCCIFVHRREKCRLR